MLGTSLAAAASIMWLSAQGEPAVSWTAPPACPDVNAIHGRIEDLLGRGLERDELKMQGHVTAEANGWSLHLRVTVGDVVDERTLRDDDCEALAQAAALVSAIMLDPNVAETLLLPEPPETPPSESTPQVPEANVSSETTDEIPAAPEQTQEELQPQPTQPDATKPQPKPQPKPRQPKPPQRGLSLWVRGMTGGEYGAIPGGTGGFGLAVGVGTPRVRGELMGTYWIGRQATSANASARIHLGTTVLRVCGTLPTGVLSAAFCGGIELGAMRADAQSPAPRTEHGLWLAAHTELGLRWRFSQRVSLWISAQPFVRIVYPDYNLVDPNDPERIESIYAPSAAGIRGLAGIELRAWPATLGAPN